ncbi:MAG: hypothetical protein QXG86_01340 [Candidatus Woesearchaeota archaeon]
MAEQEVIINYETLFEILRREKNREEIQKLPEDFFEKIRSYIEEKKQTTLVRNDDPFSDIENEKTQRQLVNIKKIVKEIYERREKKIIAMALNKSRIPASVMDTSLLLPEERRFYEQLVDIFNKTREEVLLKSLNNEKVLDKKESECENPSEEKPVLGSDSEEKTQFEGSKEEGGSFENASTLKTIKFVVDVGQFVGPNLEIYGPYSKDEVANLPQEVCNVLVNKNKAIFFELGE